MLLEAAEAALPEGEAELFGQIAVFVRRRIEGAGAALERTKAAPSVEATQCELHVFLRECWEALDGLGRLVSLSLEPLYPGAGLAPAGRMTRQCTFYTVRRDLSADADAAEHPLSVLVWHETREEPSAAYRTLSFLYNVSLFAAVPLPGGRLPGWQDLPACLKTMVRRQPVEGGPVPEGLEEVLEWEKDFVRRCYTGMARTLDEGGRRG